MEKNSISYLKYLKTILLTFVGSVIICSLSEKTLAAVDYSIDGEGASAIDVTSTQDAPHGAAPAGTLDRDLNDDGKVYENQRDGMGERPWISGSTYRQGSRGLGIRVHPSITGSNGLNIYSKDRSEYWFEGSRYGFERSGPTQSVKIPLGTDQYTGFSVKVPAGFPLPNVENAFSSAFVFSQWWQYGPASPPMAMRLFKEGSTLKYLVEVRNDATGPDAPVNGGTPAIVPTKRTMPTNQFVDFILKFKAVPTGSGGYLYVWQKVQSKNWDGSTKPTNWNGNANSSLVVNQPSINIGYSQSLQNQDAVTVLGAGAGLHHKFGIYRPGAFNATQYLFFDEIRNATFFTEVNSDVVATHRSYRLKSKYNSKCLAVAGASTANGADVLTWNCGNSGNYRWSFVNQGPEIYQLRPTHSNKCIGLNSDDAVQETCSSANEHKWKLVDRTNGWYEIRSTQNGSRCLGLTAAGDVREQVCNSSNTGQQWIFVD